MSFYETYGRIISDLEFLEDDLKELQNKLNWLKANLEDLEQAHERQETYGWKIEPPQYNQKNFLYKDSLTYPREETV